MEVEINWCWKKIRWSNVKAYVEFVSVGASINNVLANWGQLHLVLPERAKK